LNIVTNIMLFYALNKNRAVFTALSFVRKNRSYETKVTFVAWGPFGPCSTANSTF
jgi:hypothetical protein